jgi:ubiquinone/menaquinone biosynthesis C-methylase UbiE
MTGIVSCRDAWDREYLRRGRRFGRAPPDLPFLFPGAMVLEAGCGDGKTLSAMVSRRWQVLALDFSSEAIKICTRSPVLEGISYLIADAAELPVCGNSCDAVFLSHIIGHAPERERWAIARETIRILKRGGRLFFRDFSLEDYRAGTGTQVETGTRVRGDGIQTHYFSRPEVWHLFSDLSPVSIREELWFMRVRKERLRRVEIVAEFRKTHNDDGNDSRT